MKLYSTINATNNVGVEVKHSLNDSLIIHVVGGYGTDEYWLQQLERIGQVVGMDEDKITLNKTGRLLTDIKYDPSYPAMFAHANVRQPLHTDGSYEADAPNISFLYCVKKALVGGATTFLPVPMLKQCLEYENPDLLNKMFLIPITHSKGNDKKTKTILDQQDRINWNYFRAEKNGLTEQLHHYLETRIMQMGLCYDVHLNEGDALFFQDDRVLHGRNAFIGPRWLRKGGIKWTPTLYTNSPNIVNAPIV